MLERVQNKTVMYNNTGRIADSAVLSIVKIYYYKIALFLYGKMGKYVDLLMTNSTWTFEHIEKLWNATSQASRAHKL